MTESWQTKINKEIDELLLCSTTLDQLGRAFHLTGNIKIGSELLHISALIELSSNKIGKILNDKSKDDWQ